MKGLTLIALFMFLNLAGGTGKRRNWRGIVPLHSTRADVERLLGPPTAPPKNGMRIYTPDPDTPLDSLEDEEVGIGYMNPARAEQMSCSSIPLDTVLWIHVSLKKYRPLSELGIDESRFETFDPSSPPNIGIKAYVDVINGMYVWTVEGNVEDFGYYGDARDRQVCPSLHMEPKQHCLILVDFFDYSPKPKNSKSD